VDVEVDVVVVADADADELPGGAAFIATPALALAASATPTRGEISPTLPDPTSASTTNPAIAITAFPASAPHAESVITARSLPSAPFDPAPAPAPTIAAAPTFFFAA
jgi:hypothetical protein